MNSCIDFETGKDKLIVMPFRPGPGQGADGIGLGVHFFLGNLICLHPGLLECWFGWRVKKIFPHPDRLTAYCRGQNPSMDILGLGAGEKVRFWIEGRYCCAGEAVSIEVVLHDARDSLISRSGFTLEPEGGLLGFGRAVFDWIRDCGITCDGYPGGLWPEKISLNGLDHLGEALGVLYLNYVDGAGAFLDLAHFEKAVSTCPDSYLCQDLLGWGLYKNGHHGRAAEAFTEAVVLNPDGMGALAGLMWCALAEKDLEKTLHYALEKGRCRGEDPKKARAFVVNKFS